MQIQFSRNHSDVYIRFKFVSELAAQGARKMAINKLFLDEAQAEKIEINQDEIFISLERTDPRHVLDICLIFQDGVEELRVFEKWGRADQAQKGQDAAAVLSLFLPLLIAQQSSCTTEIDRLKKELETEKAWASMLSEQKEAQAATIRAQVAQLKRIKRAARII